MHEYLFNNGVFPFKETYYRFLMINLEDKDSEMVFNFLRELFCDGIILKNNTDYFLFYFLEPEIISKELFVSMSDDFSVNIKIYISGRIEASHPENFRTLYQAVKESLAGKPYIYATNANLIQEIIRTDFMRLKDLKPAILNRISDDSQIEKLILTLFENNLNVTRTAKAVYMHRNTINNKLEYIRQETGLNMQNFTDAACMYWLYKSK
jgi:hypothetical protein